MTAPSQTPEAAGLEPCPFCGAPAISGLNFEDTAYVMCSRDDKDCGAMIGWRRSEAEAVNLWNRRVTAASAQAAIGAEKARADRLASVLIEALPYVESCEYDNGYKPGAVLRVVKNIQTTLQQETQP